MPDLEKSHNVFVGFDRKYEEVTLIEQDLLDCFQPLVQAIINLVRDQIEKGKKSKELPVKIVILIGGLGCSNCIRDSLKNSFEKDQTRMITSWSGAWSAVARGAALHGLGAVKIQNRITRRYYGQQVSRPFRRGNGRVSANLWKTKWKDPWTGDIMINDNMQWLIAKDTVFGEDTEIEASWEYYYQEGTDRISSNKLYSYSLDTAPAKFGSAGIAEVGTFLVNFEGVNLNQFEFTRDEASRCFWKLPVRVFVKLGARQGTFTFRTSIAGKECGVAHMDFSGH